MKRDAHDGGGSVRNTMRARFFRRSKCENMFFVRARNYMRASANASHSGGTQKKL